MKLAIKNALPGVKKCSWLVSFRRWRSTSGRHKGTAAMIIFLLLTAFRGVAQEANTDSLLFQAGPDEKYDQFYDSLKYKAGKNKITKLFYDFLISPPGSGTGKEFISKNHYRKFKGKVISDITIKPLDVFGPTLRDTSRRAHSWIEKTANAIHTNSNLNTIRKLLLFEVGDFISPEQLYENERIIRSLPYIQDVRIILEQDTVYEGLAKVHIITKDRFSIGASGGVNGGKSAALEIYNQNIFGVGHEISLNFVGNLKTQPYTGLETFYKINNIRGKFIDIAAGYMNTYLKEGFSFVLEKPFITPSMKWGYGASALRMFRTDRIFESRPLETALPLDYSFFSAWAGRSYQLKPGHLKNSQLILSGGVYHRSYFQRPVPASLNHQYFSNHTFYLAGITFTQRRYKQDKLVYSYGVTEDIPEGFKNELVIGYDANEFGNRHYAHLYFSNGNLLRKRRGYLFLEGGIGGYFKQKRYEQGLITGGLNYISRQINAGQKRSRFFLRSHYMLGIRRFDIESLDFNRNNFIRGFSSREATGKQRLSLDMEYVLFLRKQFYKFNMAVFSFADLGIIGSNKRLIFNENYYSGIGLGVRLHNEHLAFKTLRLRLSFYPFAPSDMNFTGFILEEQTKKDFYSFQPEAPHPLRFE